MAKQHTPWGDKKFPKEYKKIIEILYKNGKAMRTSAIQKKVGTKEYILPTLKKIQSNHGYIRHFPFGSAKVGSPILFVFHPGKSVERVSGMAKEEKTFIKYSEKLAEITGTKPVEYKSWVKDRRKACIEYNKLLNKYKLTQQLPGLNATYTCWYWTILKSAIPILEKVFGKLPKSK